MHNVFQQQKPYSLWAKKLADSPSLSPLGCKASYLRLRGGKHTLPFLALGLTAGGGIYGEQLASIEHH